MALVDRFLGVDFMILNGICEFDFQVGLAFRRIGRAPPKLCSSIVRSTKIQWQHPNPTRKRGTSSQVPHLRFGL
jgi:hypothetical protein